MKTSQDYRYETGITSLVLYILDPFCKCSCLYEQLSPADSPPSSPLSYPSQNKRLTEMMEEKNTEEFCWLIVFTFASTLNLLSEFSPIFVKGAIISGLSQQVRASVLRLWLAFFATFVLNPNNTFSSCLQSLLCSQSINIASALPVLEPLTEADNVGLTIRVLCNTRLGKYEEAIDQLLRWCPDAAVFYAQHELKGANQVGYFQYSYLLSFGVFSS